MLPTDRAHRRNAQPISDTRQQHQHNYQSQPTQQQHRQLSTMQKVMQFAERDDLLLYLTAAFGIIMPAIMYFFYRTMHNKYHAYCNKLKEKKLRKIKAKKNKRTITIFYCGTSSPTKRIAYDLAENIDQFDPIVANLSTDNIHKRIKNSLKAVFIFIVSTEIGGETPDLLCAFFDWLDEIRYEHRLKSFLCNTSFAIFGLSSSSTTQSDTGSVDCTNNKPATNLQTRLCSLQGHPLYKTPFIVNFDDSADIVQKLRLFSNDLIQSLKQFQYGAFDETNKQNTSDDESISHIDEDEIISSENESVSSAEYEN